MAMLRVRSSGCELDIEGTADDFIQLRSAISSLVKSSDRLYVDVRCDDPYDPAPYSQWHDSIRIAVGCGPNQFNHSNSQLQLVGSPKCLMNFAGNFPDGADYKGPAQYHHHYDHLSFPDYVSDSSPEITLSLVKV